jgi:hypothetical protein
MPWCTVKETLNSALFHNFKRFKKNISFFRNIYSVDSAVTMLSQSSPALQYDSVHCVLLSTKQRTDIPKQKVNYLYAIYSTNLLIGNTEIWWRNVDIVVLVSENSLLQDSLRGCSITRCYREHFVTCHGKEMGKNNNSTTNSVIIHTVRNERNK